MGKRIRVKKEKPDGKFIVWVDGMDGDVYCGSLAVGQAVQHALDNGAKSIEIKQMGT